MSWRDGWRRYTGPIVLTAWKRRWYRALLVLWVALAVASVATGRVDLSWVPLAGTAGTGYLLVRDRSGRSSGRR